MKEFKIKIKAFLLLFSFLGVQLISIGCTFSNYIHHLSHENNSSENHHEHHHEHHRDSESATPNESEGESCCSESSSIFLSGVEAIPSINHWLKPFDSIKLITFLDDRTNSACLYETIVKQIRPPPLKAAYSTCLRICIQSFQI